jgi:hypothetical protein
MRMQLEWLPRALVPLVIVLILILFSRIAPPRSRLAKWRFDQQQVPEPLPTGVIGGTMWALGIFFALTFFVFQGANRLWANADGPAELAIYALPALWVFFPFVAALSIPWPLTIWWLRRVGRKDEADGICDAADSKGNMDIFQVMKWLVIGLAGPVCFFTVLAIPIHLSICKSEARLGHYASLRTERFPFNQATRATLTDGIRLRDGSLYRQKDLIIDFADGRRLRGNELGDGGTDVSDSVVQLLLQKTGLHPDHVEAVEDIPAR